MRLAHILICHTVTPTRLFDSIPHGGEDDIWYTFLHSSNDAVARLTRAEMSRRRGNLFPYETNRGLALSWNDALSLACQSDCHAALLLNDDLHFTDGGYGVFRQTVQHTLESSNNISHITTMGLEAGSSTRAGQVVSQDFACCAISREAVETVGYFDEFFTPAYYEDLDWARRASLLGMQARVENTCCLTHERSSTMHLANDSEKRLLEMAMARNADYFDRKWGGGVHTPATYDAPFQDRSMSLKISHEGRWNSGPMGGAHRAFR